MNELFMTACYDGNLDEVKKMITSVNLAYGGYYAIRHASRLGHIEIVRLLLEHTSLSDFATEWALKYANKNCHIEVVQLLTEHQFRLDGPEYTRGIL